MAWPAPDQAMHRTSSSMVPNPKSLLSLSSFLSSILFCYLICSFPSCHADLASDANALLAFKGSVTSPQSSILASWNSSSIASICSSWEGVTCTGSGSSQRVTTLRLPGTSLDGPIPAGTLGSLDALDTLSLRSNKLSGVVPADLANCASLRRLYLQRNNLTGVLPANFSAWPLMTQLDLSSNGFIGTIPSSIVSLTRLKNLYLQNNSLSGEIPAVNNGSLTNISVANNNLSGSIPETLKGFPAASFAGNAALCGAPLLIACVSAPIPSSPPSSSPVVTTGSSSKKNLSTGAIVGIVFACIAFLLIVFLLMFIVMVNRKKRSNGGREAKQDLYANGRSKVERKREGGPGTGTAATNGHSAAAAAGGATMSAVAREQEQQQEGKNGLVFLDKNGKQTFDLEDLLRASAEVLGKGSLGTSYKAMMDDGLIVAVKRLRDVTSDKDDFTQRIEMLGRLRHPNLVPVRAYYFAKQEKLLVFDYMPNGSLSALLHANKGTARGPLDWESRLGIARAVARGVAYLHAQGLVHANIKSANVLLAGDNQPCLSDFGLMPLVTIQPGATSHKSVGYVAPEVTDMRKVSFKADVYSVGVLLLELLTGKSPTQAAMSEDDVDLPRWVQSVVREEWTAEVFDLDILKRNPEAQEEMMELLQIAMPCVSRVPDRRPAIADVAASIDGLPSKPRSAAHVDDRGYPPRQPGHLHHDDDDDDDDHVYDARDPRLYELGSSYAHHNYPGRFDEISSGL